MLNPLLYLCTILIWGSTWFAIKFQLGIVTPAASVAYRFAIASALLFAWCFLKKSNLRFSRTDHAFMALQGFFMFATNYLLSYIANQYLTSGINAVLFSSVMIFNIINSALFFGTAITWNIGMGAALGLAGIATVFWPELRSIEFSEGPLVGMAYSVGGALSASFGNMISARHRKRSHPVTVTNAFGMGYGALFICGFLAANGQSFQFDFSTGYLLSLAYLSLFGTIIAFGCYLTLLGRIGPQRAAYALILSPIVALGISTFFESYTWSAASITGIALIVLGNILIMVRRVPLLVKRGQKLVSAGAEESK